MEKTEKKYWQNGYQLRGLNCHSLCMSLGNYGVLISWWGYKKKITPNFRFYKLTK